MISVKEAAERTGMSKAGIFKALRQGKISAGKNLNGEWEIDPVELFRIYPPLSTSAHQDTIVHSEYTVTESEHLRTQLQLQRELIDNQQETIRILTARLEAAERMQLQLTDKQQPRPWWQRFIGGGA